MPAGKTHVTDKFAFQKYNCILLFLHKPWLHHHFLNSPARGKGMSFGLMGGGSKKKYIPEEKKITAFLIFPMFSLLYQEEKFSMIKVPLILFL